MRTIAYRVRNIRAFFVAVVLLSLTTTTLIPLLGQGDTREAVGDPLFSDNGGALQSFETVLPPVNCSFKIEMNKNLKNMIASTTRSTRSTNHTIAARTRPIWVPGYPGSGSELFRDLVQTMTGDPAAAADIYKDVTQRCSNAVTCKTHWPAYPHHAPGKHDQKKYNHTLKHAPKGFVFAPNVVLLLRNPATALASHFNFKWEAQHGMTDHTVQAPQAAWNEWRDQRLGRQVEGWKRMILTWHRHSYYRVTLYVPYERLVDRERGPVEASKLANEFRRAVVGTESARHVAAATDIPCVWRTVVRDKPRRQRRQGHRYQPSYTVQQQQIMVDMLNEIMRELPDQAALKEILTEYLYEIQTSLRIDGIR
jgi:hypothetical protein